MISIIMPYWNRPEQLKASLEKFKEFYSDVAEEFEIIIVDDFSPLPIPYMEDFPISIQIVHIHKEKRIAMNPCVPINQGVWAANGNIILLTNPEVIHRSPILFDMADRLELLGPKGYIAAACWYTDLEIFICHTTLDKAKGRAPIPKGAGLHFCSMMYKDFFDEVKGFDEDYREGQGYEDNDFLWKLKIAGAQFEIADDLITEHPNTRTEWPVGGLTRNKKIFYNKWSEEIKNVRR